MSKPKNKGIAKAARHQRRIEGEKRNADYQLLPLEKKLARQIEGGRVWQKLQSQK